MSTTKRLSMVFLGAINLMTLAAGIITELKILLGKDVTSIIPITAELTVNQILLLNFMTVVIVMGLISIVTAYIVTDVAYSPKEIILNCPGITLILPVIIMAVGMFNAINAAVTADKICIAVSAIIYLLINVINFGCVFTIKYDSDEE